MTKQSIRNFEGSIGNNDYGGHKVNYKKMSADPWLSPNHQPYHTFIILLDTGNHSLY